jgi:hypothetical protein
LEQVGATKLADYTDQLVQHYKIDLVGSQHGKQSCRFLSSHVAWQNQGIYFLNQHLELYCHG